MVYLVLVIVFSAMLLSQTKFITEPDESLKKSCREYADSHPERSIPDSRKEWLTSQGFDYVNYDYYQDCINQKLDTFENMKEMYGNTKSNNNL